MRRRFWIFLFNVALAVSVATLYAWALSGGEILGAFLATCGAGLAVGATVGLGAVFGPRPALPMRKCVVAQAMVVVGAVIGAWIGSFFPGEIEQAEEALRGYLENRGIVVGTSIGTIVGTALTILDVYRQRRKAARKQERKER